MLVRLAITIAIRAEVAQHERKNHESIFGRKNERLEAEVQRYRRQQMAASIQ
jgi:hypothetical protein